MQRTDLDPTTMGDRIRRSEGRMARTAVASAKVTKAEHREIVRAAASDQKALSEWSREVLLRAARTRDTDRVLLTEITAIRMLLLSVLRPLALGENMDAASFQSILNEVRANKHDNAKSVLEQYTTTEAGGR